MKKEKREYTIEQLKEMEKKTIEVSRNTMIFLFIVSILAITLIKKIDWIIPVYCFFLLASFIVLILVREIGETLQEKILSEEKRIESERIVEKSKKVNLKNYVELDEECLITYILSRNIVNVSIDKIEDEYFETTIHLIDNTSQSEVYIPISELISILDEKSKNEILQKAIREIKVEKNMNSLELSIDTQGVKISESLSSSSLLEMLKLKE